MLPVVVKIEQDRIKGAPSFGQSGGEKKMIKLGLRGKLEVLSFLTGQLMVSFDFYPNNPPQLRNIKDLYPELPTLPISPDIFKLMNEVPIKEIAKNLEATAVGINRLVNESDLQSSLYDMRETFQETKKAMQSVRLLTEYLEQHPEAILQGKSVTKGE
jgi:paraquat-inducible protein B